jgi:dihydrofolate reductase
MISLIVAYAHNNVIGNDGRIPWDLPDDREHFKKLTLGSVVVMGRRTFEEIYKKFGAGLPGRETIVISKTQNFQGENYRTVISLQAALELAQSQFPEKEIFICGGESVYREAITQNLAQTLYLTEIDADIPGDAYFPDFDKNKYNIEEKITVSTPIPHTFIKCNQINKTVL